MSAVGVGVIGAGNISLQYLTAMARFPDLRVRFLADLDVEQAARRAAEFGIPRSGSVDDLLADDGIEIVVNLTIPAAHVEVGMRVVESGRHVWSEKPLALNTADGRALLQAGRAAGVRVACAPDTVLGAGLQSAARLVGDGAIGAPLTALGMFRTAGPQTWHPNPAFLFARGGGPLMDMGPYFLTALVTLLGPIASVTAAASTSHDERTIGSGPRAGERFAVEVPTFHGALLSFEGGASAQVAFSFQAHRDLGSELELVGTDGALTLPDPNEFTGPSELWTAGSPEPRVVPAAGAEVGRGVGVLELARAIRAGRPERVSGELALHVLDAMQSIALSAAEQGTVRLETTVPQPQPLPADWDPFAATL